MSPHSPLFAELQHDRQRVQDAQLPHLQEKLLTFSATAEEAREWYFSEDPVYETENEEYVRSKMAAGVAHVEGYFRVFDAQVDRARTHEALALTLLANVVDPDTVGENPDRWHAKMYEQNPLIKYEEGMDVEMLAGHLFRRLPKDPTAEQMSDLYMALDSMHLCYRKYNNIGQMLSADDDASPIEAANQKASEIKGDVYFGLSANLSAYMTHKGLSFEGSNDDEIRKLAFRAGLFGGAVLIERSMGIWRANQDEGTRALATITTANSISIFTDLVNDYFLKTLDPSVRALKGSIKGELHEALYLMDMIYLFNTDKRYAKWQAMPMFPRLDSPKVGYPKLRRGYDVGINNGERSAIIQLKSGSMGDDVAYHPRIWQLREKNFQDVDVRRLGAKLAAYKRWADSDCGEQDAEAVNRYVLPTARETLSRIDEMERLSSSEYLLGTTAMAGVTRAERRRLQRNLGEFSTRKNKSRKR